MKCLELNLISIKRDHAAEAAALQQTESESQSVRVK